MKTNLLIILVSALTDLSAQTTLPYFTGFDNVSQQAGWTIHNKGVQPPSNWSINTAGGYSAPGSISHYYPVGGSSPVNDWFVSPAFNFSSGGNIDSLRYFFSGFGNPVSSDTVAIYLLKGSPDPALASGKTMLFDFRGTNYVNDAEWRRLANITIPATPGQSYIAFKYTTTINWLDVKFDNLKLRNNIYVNIDDQSDISPSINVFTNPTNGVLNFTPFDFASKYDTKMSLFVYDLSGRMVLNEIITFPASVHLSLESGLYTYKFYNPNLEVIQRGKIMFEADK